MKINLTDKIQEEIVFTIEKVIRDKLSEYNPETTYMPFHYKLIGKDRMALFSFIHSFIL